MKIKYMFALLLIALLSTSVHGMEESPSSMDIETEVSASRSIDAIRKAALEEIQVGDYGRLKPMLLEFFAQAHDSSFAGSDQDFVDLMRLAISSNHQKVIQFLKYFHILESKLIWFIRAFGRIELIELFVRAGADLHHKDDGYTALTAATISGLNNVDRAIKILGILINAGANINHLSFDETALFTALLAREIALIKFLLLNGADPDLPTKGYILRWACRGGNTEIIELLLALPGTDINYVNQDAYRKEYDTVSHSDCTVIAAAISGDKIEILDLVLKHGADINIQDPFGWTPLMIASIYGFIDTVTFLLDHGVDTTIKNKRGQTALDLAREWRSESYLKEKQKHVIALLASKK